MKNTNEIYPNTYLIIKHCNKLIFQLDQRSLIIMSELFVFVRKRRISISILFMLMQNDLCYLGYWEEEEEEVHINIVYAHAEWFYWEEEEEEVHINIHQICSPDPILPSPGWIFTNFVRQFYQKFCQAILSKILSGNFIKSFVRSSREKRLFSFPTNYVKCVEIVVQVYFNVKRENPKWVLRRFLLNSNWSIVLYESLDPPLSKITKTFSSQEKKNQNHPAANSGAA